MAKLTSEEESVIRLTFLHGRKWAEINAVQTISSRDYFNLKQSALEKLKEVVDPVIMGM